MNEKPPEKINSSETMESIKDPSERRSELSLNLNERCENGERFPFFGITSEADEILRKENEDLPLEYACDYDELLSRFSDQGFRVVSGKDPLNSEIFPGDSEEINDILRPKHLKVTAGMDPELIELITLAQANAETKKSKK